MKTFAIPARRNLVVASAQLIAMLSLLWAAGQVTPWWAGALLALGYGVVMNSGYAMRHEAEHGILHPHRGLNDAVGTVLALFFSRHFTSSGRGTSATTSAIAATTKPSICILRTRAGFGSADSSTARATPPRGSSRPMPT